jgi:hypothetical protein
VQDRPRSTWRYCDRDPGFLRAFEALVTRTGAGDDPDTQPAAASGPSFARPQKRAAMPPRFRCSLWPSGSISTGPPAPRSRYRTTSWIALHDNPNFRGFVDLLRAQFDRIDPMDGSGPRLFRRAVALELSFFEIAYTDGT